MKKLIKFLLVQREELNKKWWHRLANVLICGSTIVFFGFFIFNIVGTSAYKEYSYIYSFEPNYSQAKGQETPCHLEAMDYGGPYISCGDIYTSTEFLTRYDKARGTYNSSTTSDGYDKAMDLMIRWGELKDIKAKMITNYNYNILFKDIGLLVLLTIVWFVFWESIIYRAIVYIIYGRKNK